MNATIKRAKLLGLEALAEVSIEKGVITNLSQTDELKPCDADEESKECWLLPGLIDLSVHLEQTNQAQSHAQNAYAQGFSHICIQPDTHPVVDSGTQVRSLDKQNSQNAAKILPIGALTQGLNGEQLANMAQLKEAGCVALSHTRKPIANSYVLRRCMEYARTFDMLLMLSANDAHLGMQGCVHEGAMSTRLGLAPHPEVAETVALSQILLLAESTGARVHISQISCAKSMLMIRQARESGLEVSADVGIANLLYTHEHVSGFNSLYHLEPVLRTQADRQALLSAVNQGELAICSNHRAFSEQNKQAPFAQTESGFNTSNNFIRLLLELINSKELDMSAAFTSLSTLPAKILGIPTTQFEPGSHFDGFLFDGKQVNRL